MRVVVCTLIALVGGMAIVAQAAPVTVNNHSFESPILGVGGFTGVLPGWQSHAQDGGASGVYHPGAGQFAAVPDGNQTSITNGGTLDGFLGQVLGEPLVAGATYTLQVDVGHRLDVAAFPAATIQLRAGGVVLGQFAPADPGLGNFTTATVNYTATAADSQLGKPLEVRLLGAGVQPNFDNVRLDSTLLSTRTPVAITNPSFEADVLGDGGAIVGISGWTTGGNQGTFNPTAAQGFPTDGNNIAYSAGGSISQILSETLQANTNYQLTVDIIDRLDVSSPGYQVQLLAGGVLLAEDNNTLLPVPTNGDFLTSLVSYDALAGDPQLGQALEIRLISAAGQQTNFDNVRLSTVDITIPEPSSMWIWSISGILGMAAGFWRSRKKLIA